MTEPALSIPSDEINKLQTEIEKIDPNAFIVMNRVKDLKGGMIKKRQFKAK